MPSGCHFARSPVRNIRAPVWRERIRDETRLGQLGPAVITAREAVAADVHLAGHADWNRLLTGVQHVDLIVRNGTTDVGQRHRSSASTTPLVATTVFSVGP